MEYLYFNLAQLRTRSSDVRCECSSYFVTGHEHKSYLSVHIFYIAQMFDSICDSIITGQRPFLKKKKKEKSFIGQQCQIYPLYFSAFLVQNQVVWSVMIVLEQSSWSSVFFKYFNVKARWNYIYLLFINTMQCHGNAINFLQYPHNKHPIVHPWGLDTCMGYLLRVQSSICIMLLLLHCWM